MAERERKAGLHTLNTLATVLVIVVLIGGAAALVYLNNHAHGSQPNTPVGVFAQAVPTPMPRSDCSHVFVRHYAPNNFTMADNGEHAVCLQGEEVSLQGTATVNGHRIMLISAYADANRLIVKYAVIGTQAQVSIPGGESFAPKLTIQGGTQRSPIDSQNYYDQQRQQDVFLESFATQPVPATTTTLHVTIDFFAFTDSIMSKTSDASFNFMVPFHDAQRVTVPNMMVSIHGHTITLDRVVVTASMTMLHLNVNPRATSYGEVELNAQLEGNSILLAGTTDAAGNDKMGNLTGWYGFAEQDFLNKQGVWTLNIQGRGPLGPGSGTIQFIVPG